MTRGKIQFVEKNWEVYSTLEFNGDMYPSGHGHEIIMHFKKGGFRTRDDYETYAVDFDKRNFGYCNAGYGLISSLGTYEGTKNEFCTNSAKRSSLFMHTGGCGIMQLALHPSGTATEGEKCVPLPIIYSSFGERLYELIQN